MINLTINGEKKDRQFSNMAQALAFAYQNGECYGAKSVVLSGDGIQIGGGEGGAKKNPIKCGGFTQADLDAACEKAVKAVTEENEQLFSQLESLDTMLASREAGIAELEKKLAEKQQEVTDPSAQVENKPQEDDETPAVD